MKRSAEGRVQHLQLNGERGLLRGSRRGLEKESLRVTSDGHIARTPHPKALGSALTHPSITTDYSEALLEFVTPPYSDTADLLDFLDGLHHYTYHHIGDELLWATSMPCIVGGDSSIPIAEYGCSNVGRMKHVYRRGLDWRYGRAMQAISGIHFNYSLSEDFLAAVQAAEGDRGDFRTFRSELYFRLIRNFQRFGWLVPFLHGASPAICKSFTGGQNLHFQELGAHTFYEPWATSLRMSDIGYKNKAQAALSISYNNLEEYVTSLRRAITTPDPEYQRIGTRVDGEWRQLNTNVLQIENEYYSFVRPKAATRSGEQPTLALRRAGVEYVEIRALDLNPFEPLGVNARQLAFMEILLVYCLLEESPPIDARERGWINANQGLVARQGRDPRLTLHRGDGGRVRLLDWAAELFDAMAGPAELLDEVHGDHRYRDVLAEYRRCAEDPGCTPSARVLAEMQDRGEEFVQFALRVSRAHAAAFRRRELPEDLRQRLAAEARASLEAQREIEAADTLPFEAYLQRYFAQG
ncbi:glutamate--cysteine ligase [Spiribacter halobius]|uniref:Glutamate--cysteine ligase n=1 Tax=Sediminicurvatus halobius TaxID=2182432 RepID=A0A2U2N6C1_9GAMM|nr:glutamate--cysteine ligase [Spiribacter halobius]PWG64642.1 glutamate--cysteine ligase [Spiribacter halobius]UEX79033.1 glutamate--cysteine ligase [Spiribacter halobius]